MEKDDIEDFEEEENENFVDSEEVEDDIDDDYAEEVEDDEAQEELFRENPLKAIWIKLKELEDSFSEGESNDD